MHKNTVKAALLAFAVFASVLMIVALVVTSTVRNAAAGATGSVQASGSAGGYTLRAFHGHIAVYYGDILDCPAVETTIDVGTLRAVDREKLDSGIQVRTYDEVLKLLEDFGS